MQNAPLRRLIDLAGVRDLEFKAVMKPAMAEPWSRADFPELDECSRAIFGITADEADETEHPAGWDRIETRPAREQVEAFEAAGWDVTDDKRRPMRLLPQFAHQLWLAIRGVAGTLPFHAEVDTSQAMETALAKQAAAFRRDRR
jgi:hypothetical protein